MTTKYAKLRWAIANPKICKKPPIKPVSTPPPPPPPEWPPPKIWLRVECSGGVAPVDKSFEGTPGDFPDYIAYHGTSAVGYVVGEVHLIKNTDPPLLEFYTASSGWPVPYGGTYGPKVPVDKNGFSVSNTQWQYNTPPNATIKLTATYPVPI